MTNNQNAMDTLKGLLGNDADKKIQAVMDSLSNSGESNTEQLNNTNSLSNNIKNNLTTNSDNLEYIMRIKNIIDELGSTQNDARSNLLLSLKPYMRSNRQKSIDSAVKMLNLTKISGIFNIK